MTALLIRASSREVGSYRVNEIGNVVTVVCYRPNGTRRGIIVGHGDGQTGDDLLSTTSPTHNVLWQLVAAGYPLFVADLGAGVSQWGNDDSIAATAAAWTWFAANAGVEAGHVGFYGVSMGALGLNWIRANLASVFAMGGAIPVLDLNDVYTNNKGGAQGEIGTAYGVTFPAALPNLATHSPVAYGSTDLAGLPVSLWTTSDDPVASNTAAAMAWSGKGATVTVTDTGANGHSPIGVNAQQVVAFFDANGGRT